MEIGGVDFASLAVGGIDSSMCLSCLTACMTSFVSALNVYKYGHT